jgi:glycosyltransferase involved in cell wall biosynthesis
MAIKITYAVTVKDEVRELTRLLTILTDYVDLEDEIIVQVDCSTDVNVGVMEVLTKFENQVRTVLFPLVNPVTGNPDFSTFKNNLSKEAKGNFIFQLDADETIGDFFITNLKKVLEVNPTVDLIWVPRVNKVIGLTQEYITKWNWHVDSEGRVNYPDMQGRIYRVSPYVIWYGKVHEMVTGKVKAQTMLPYSDDWSIFHIKEMEKQIKQNTFYEEFKS